MALSVHTIIFSKDRAFQLEQLLWSIQLYTNLSSISVLYTTSQGNPKTSSPAESSNEFSSCACNNESYLDVNRTFPEVKFIHEEEGRFGEQLFDLLDFQNNQQNSRNFVSFLVDDLIFYDKIDISCFAHSLMEHDNALSAHLKLHPGVVWSHAANKACVRPSLVWHKSLSSEDPSSSSSSSSTPFLKFKRCDGTGDWDYPFDLCGGLYRLEDILLIVSFLNLKHHSNIKPPGTTSDSTGFNKVCKNPNKLESQFDRVYQSTMRIIQKQTQESMPLSTSSSSATATVVSPSSASAALEIQQDALSLLLKSKPFSLCVDRPVLNVVTINCVQKTFKVPIYQLTPPPVSSPISNNPTPPPPSAEGGAGGSDWPIEWCGVDGSVNSLEFLRVWSHGQARCGFDFENYRAIAHRHCSVHIGDFLLKEKPSHLVMDGETSTIENVLSSVLIKHSEINDNKDKNHLNPNNQMINDGQCIEVSVLIPVYNGEAYICDALRSVLDMEYEKSQMEVVVVDDGSTDNTLTIVKTISFEDDRIRIVELPHNRGIIGALTEGLKLCRGKFVARMDADDVCELSRLKRQLLHLTVHPNLSAVGGSITLFSDDDLEAENIRIGSCEEGDIGCHSEAPITGHSVDGDILNLKLELGRKCVIHPSEPLALAWLLTFSCCMAHPTVTFNTKVVKSIGGYRETARGAEDYDLWLRLAHAPGGGIANLATIAGHHRRHAHNLTLVPTNSTDSNDSPTDSAEKDGLDEDDKLIEEPMIHEHFNFPIITEEDAMVEWNASIPAQEGQGDHHPYPMKQSSFTALRIVYSFIKYHYFHQSVVPIMTNQLSPTSSSICSIRNLALLRNLDQMKECSSLDDFQNAAQLLLHIEKSVLCKNFPYESIAVRDLVKSDATSRLGELAVTSMAQFSSSAIDIWQLWAKRDPKAQIAMLKLMLK